MPRIALLLAVVALTAGEAAPASAARLTAGAPVTVADGDGSPELAPLPRGAALIAWAGHLAYTSPAPGAEQSPPNGREGVFVRRRSASGALRPVQRVAPDNAGGVTVAGAGDGAAAIAWFEHGVSEQEPSRVRVAVAAPGGRFGPPEDPPAQAAHRYDRPSVAVTRDRTVVVVWLHRDVVMAAVRRPGRGWATQALGGAAVRSPQVRSSGSEALAVWTAGGPYDRRVLAAELAGGAFRPPVQISRPGQDPGNEPPSPALLADGRAAIAYSTEDTSGGGSGAPGPGFLARRSRSGRWSAPRQIALPGGRRAFMGPAAGLTRGGDLLAVDRQLTSALWPDGARVGVRLSATPGMSADDPVRLALTRGGHAVVAFREGIRRFHLAARSPGGCFGRPLRVSSAHVVSRPSLIVGGRGRGLAAWSEVTDAGSAIRLVTLRLRPGRAPRCPAA